jgi:dolichol kinase
MAWWRRSRKSSASVDAVRDAVDEVRQVVAEVETAILGQVDFDPHWFRRAFHAFAACFVVYYMLPTTGALGFVRGIAPPAVFVGAVALELFRMSGRVPTEVFFGLREYERRRISGYVYFGLATVILVTFFPQSIAVACIVGAAIGDPILGEFRRAGLVKVSILAGGAFVLGVFLLVGFHPALALFASAVMVGAEMTKHRWLDDDLLMPLLPAVVLFAITASGVFAPLGIGLPPPPIDTVLEVPAWLR